MKNILTYLYNFCLQIIFIFLLPKYFKEVYNYKILKFFIKNLSNLNVFTIFNIFKDSLKSSNFKDLNEIVNTINTELIEISEQYKSLITKYKIDFFSLMCLVIIIFKLIYFI
jgi:hypothetical protein